MMYLREKKKESKRIKKIAREEMTEEQRLDFLKNPQVSMAFLVEQCLKDPDLFNVIASGMYVFVEGRVVRNKPQYFINTDDKLELSRYALLHSKDCMINNLFITRYRPDSVVAFRGLADSDDVEVVGSKKFDSSKAETNGMRNQLKYAEKVGFENNYGFSIELNTLLEKAISDYENKDPNFLPTFSQSVFKIICEQKIDVKTFCDRTLLAPVVYSRLKTRPDYIPKYRIAVSICFGLGFDYNLTEHLLKLAGYAFNNSLESVILRVFWSLQHFDIIDLNACLESNGIQPLGTIDKE